MSQADRYEAFAAQAMRRHEEFIMWMVEHWPKTGETLSVADFNLSKRELANLLGSRLDIGESDATLPSGASTAVPDSDSEQYLPVTPAPWP